MPTATAEPVALVADGVTDPRALAAAARYDGELAALGRVARLEPYAGSKTPILHRCLLHGEEHPCRPAEALRGQGLPCCRLASCRAHGDRRKAAAGLQYDERLRAFNRLQRLEPYRDARTPILHRCLVHGDEHRCRPVDALRGGGLRCCLQASAHANGDRSKVAAAAAYDAKLAALGRLVRLEPYRNNRAPILHRCLLHREEHRCRPACALRGGGLRCCLQASMQSIADRSKATAAAAYDAKLAALGRLVRLEPYRDAISPILHRCLEHGEEHRCRPANAQAGGGLRCCGGLPSTLSAVIFGDHGPEVLEPCQLYAYAVPGRPGLVKPGIARDHAARASRSRGLYGELLAVWDLPTRRDALLLEGAILRDPGIPAPADLGELATLDGAGEVREVDADALLAHAQALVDSLAAHAGPWQAWALDNVPTLHRAERVALRRQLAALEVAA
jgi:hypothetical protein